MAVSETIVTGPKNEVLQHQVHDQAQDSIELSVNAKGEPSYCVKVYARDADDLAERLALARAVAEKHAAEIRAAKGA